MLKASELAIGHQIALVSRINFEIQPGEVILLCGSNGVGKSTLLKTIAGRLAPISGKLSSWISEKHPEPVVPAHEATMVPTHIPKVPGFTVLDFIRTGCSQESGLFTRNNRQLENQILHSMEILKLSSLADRDISQISDGEFQKACIAMALSKQADLILLDEPTAFLDVDNKLMVLEILRDIALQQRKSFLFSSHEILESIKFCTRLWGISKDHQFLDSGMPLTGERIREILTTCFQHLPENLF